MALPVVKLGGQCAGESLYMTVHDMYDAKIKLAYT